MSDSFAGFPQDLFRFLRELRAHNQREWFQDNKDRYKQCVVEPVQAFITAMAPRLALISDAYLADPRPNGGSMFRIYRDTRFSNDKTPYKTHVGCQFRHTAGRDAHAPGFYVHLAPGEVFFCGGLWMTPNPILQQIRERIVAKPEAWQQVLDDQGLRRHFGVLQGESLKRPPRGFAADHPYIADLKRKSFVVLQEADETLATSADFIEVVTDAFTAATPLMAFVTRALGLRF